MRFISIILFVAGISVFSNASIIQVSGEVSGTWDVDTVQVMDDLLVPDNLSLSINPGVEVIFNGHYIFKVAGQVLAIGLENDPIIFTVLDTIGFYDLQTNEGAWNGFWFDHLSPNNDSTIFEYCNFEYGKAVGSDSTYWHGGAMCIREFNRLRITNCNFSNNKSFVNGAAVYCKLSDIKVEHCTFEFNNAGTQEFWGYGGAICLEYADARIYRNHFSYNSSTGVGGALSFEYSNPEIESNIFENNNSAIGGGMVCLRSDENKSIVNNLYKNNQALFFGGGLVFLETSVLLVNNTIVNNFAGQGGGLYFNFQSTPIFKNCIIWGNIAGANDGSQVYIWDIYSAPEFYYCDIQDGLEGFSGAGGNGIGFIGTYENCLETDPQFNLNGNYPFGLSDDSPCINSGTPDTLGLFLPETDLSGHDRFRGNRVDMGAYESQLETSYFSHPYKEKEVRIYPNPITNQSVISFQLNSPGEVCFSVFDINGKLVWENPKSTYQKGSNQIPLNHIKLKAGYYMIKILLSKETDTWINRKVLIL